MEFIALAAAAIGLSLAVANRERTSSPGDSAGGACAHAANGSGRAPAAEMYEPSQLPPAASSSSSSSSSSHVARARGQSGQRGDWEASWQGRVSGGRGGVDEGKAEEAWEVDSTEKAPRVARGAIPPPIVTRAMSTATDECETAMESK